MRLRDKAALITGSARGIGKGIAKVFSEEGAKVAVLDIREDEGKKVADECGRAEGRAIFVKADLKISEEVQEAIKSIIEAFGKLDILVNNAGYHISKNVLETSEEEWDYIQNTNLRSTFLCSKYSMPHLIKTKGNIINISSMVGLVGQPNACAYSATKGGQIAMSKGMAIDMAPHGVRVNVICPGWVQTPLVEDWFGQQEDEEAARKYIFSQHPLARIATVEECGKAALFLASNEEAGFITGITLNLEGGITLGY